MNYVDETGVCHHVIDKEILKMVNIMRFVMVYATPRMLWLPQTHDIVII